MTICCMVVVIRGYFPREVESSLIGASYVRQRARWMASVICPVLETPANYDDNRRHHWNSMEINGGTHWPPINFNDPHCNFK